MSQDNFASLADPRSGFVHPQAKVGTFPSKVIKRPTLQGEEGSTGRYAIDMFANSITNGF